MHLQCVHSLKRGCIRTLLAATVKIFFKKKGANNRSLEPFYIFHVFFSHFKPSPNLPQSTHKMLHLFYCEAPEMVCGQKKWHVFPSAWAPLAFYVLHLLPDLGKNAVTKLNKTLVWYILSVGGEIPGHLHQLYNTHKYYLQCKYQWCKPGISLHPLGW